MKLTIEMHDPQGQLLEELTWRGVTQDSVALTYAFCIVQLGNSADWPRINAAIRSKWRGKTALTRVKQSAWRQIQKWQQRIKESS